MLQTTKPCALEYTQPTQLGSFTPHPHPSATTFLCTATMALHTPVSRDAHACRCAHGAGWDSLHREPAEDIRTRRRPAHTLNPPPPPICAAATVSSLCSCPPIPPPQEEDLVQAVNKSSSTGIVLRVGWESESQSDNDEYEDDKLRPEEVSVSWIGGAPTKTSRDVC